MSAFSIHNSRLTLEGICKDVEHQYYERKGRDTKVSKLANEIIGMLNASGGVISFGISESGELEDLNQLAPEKLDAFRKLINDYIHPPANVVLEEITLTNGELVFLYHVEQDHERLFQRKDNEDVFLRVADSNKGPLSREEVRKLEYNKPIRSFEDELRPDFNPGDFRKSVCEYYREKMRFEGTFEELAVKRNLAARKDGTVVYKNAAILLFAEDPTQYIPNALVRYVRYSGKERRSGSEFNVIKDERFEECLPRLVELLDRFIHATLRDYYYLDMIEGKFQRIPEYPKAAWLEGIVNAICHRSYNLQGNSIYIRHYDDRLEISNSGPLPAQVTVETIMKERYSRNPRIARVLSEMGYVRELNEGVPRIFSAMHQSMLAEPVYTDVNDTVTLTLRNKVTEHKETIHADVLSAIEKNWADFTSTQRSLVNHLFEHFEATLESLAESIQVSEQAIRNNLKKLETLGIVERLSEKQRDRFAIYRFKNQ
jgi:ATP-dependent DNA helicase RecG